MPPITETQLRNTLQKLANHLHHLQQELYDTPLQATRYSQTNSRKTHSTPTPPLNLNQLHYLLDTAHPIITGWATNLATTTTTTPLPQDQPLTTWCAWLNRHRHQLLQTEWANDATTELQELETQLHHHIHPTNPHHIRLPDYATAEEIAKTLGKTTNAIHKWCKRHNITAYIQNGKTYYKTKEIT